MKQHQDIACRNVPSYRQYSVQSKHAQMEILGLAVIIILVILGLLFGMQFLKKKPTSIKQEFENKILATSFLNTLLGTTSMCHSATFRELIQDCAQGGQIQCPSGKDSCEEAKDNIAELFLALDERKQGYTLKATGPGDIAEILLFESTIGCAGEIVSGVQNIPTRFGTPIEIMLSLCVSSS